MNEETQRFSKNPDAGDSRPFGISMRGWLAVLLVVTICGMSAFGMPVLEPLYSMGFMALGFYFGQKVNQTK